MKKEILDVIATVKSEAESDFTTFFLKNVAIYDQLKNNYEFEIARLGRELKWVLYHRASLGKSTFDSPPPPYGGGTTDEDMIYYYGSPTQFDLVNIFQVMENHKGLIVKQGFEIYFLSEVSKLQDEVFRLRAELQCLVSEINQAQADIDDHERAQELREQQRRAEEYAKAERLKTRILSFLSKQELTEEDKNIFKKSYKNLGFYAKEHFRRIAPSEYVQIEHV
jgi:hypothetical protein